MIVSFLHKGLRKLQLDLFPDTLYFVAIISPWAFSFLAVVDGYKVKIGLFFF